MSKLVIINVIWSHNRRTVQKEFCRESKFVKLIFCCWYQWYHGDKYWKESCWGLPIP